MKDNKRALRRHTKKVKLLRRLKNWVRQNESYYDFKTLRRITKTRREVIESALRGECLTFLRTTGRPCNCYGCTCNKYQRELKQNVNKQIWQEIYDNS